MPTNERPVDYTLTGHVAAIQLTLRAVVRALDGLAPGFSDKVRDDVASEIEKLRFTAQKKTPTNAQREYMKYGARISLARMVP